MNVLGLDLGTKFGWYLYRNWAGDSSGIEDFSIQRGESKGIRYWRFSQWLRDFWGKEVVEGPGQIDLVVYEKIFIPKIANVDVSEVFFGMTTRLFEFCDMRETPYVAVAPTTLKKFVTGSGKATKNDMWNRYLAERQVVPLSEDECDAYWLAEWGKMEFKDAQEGP